MNVWCFTQLFAYANIRVYTTSRIPSRLKIENEFCNLDVTVDSN
jgi:hypothetical protein